jgi:hypothetical protein
VLSDDVRGTVENSESKCSECRKFPREGKGLEFGLGDKFNLETLDDAVPAEFVVWLATSAPATAAFEPLPCESSLGLPESSAISLLSLSFSLRRKSTHRSAKDW